MLMLSRDCHILLIEKKEELTRMALGGLGRLKW